jgi:hypothetical protein
MHGHQKNLLISSGNKHAAVMIATTAPIW